MINHITSKVFVAGATGNLGRRIVKALLERGATVVAGTRLEASAEKTATLRELGAEVANIDYADPSTIAKACEGCNCVVSTLAGLREVIVDAQSALLDGAVSAGVPRFIPSDFSTDYNPLVPGENRNFDLRRDFAQILDAAPISATSIFNGAFAEILKYNIPLLNLKDKVVGYWEDPDWLLDFTTTDNTASYTAAAAMDAKAPRTLHIASFQVTPSSLVGIAEQAFGQPFRLVRLGSLSELREYNLRERAAHPEGEHELYARWQQSQYMQSMFSTHHEALDNGRYPEVHWTGIASVLDSRS